MTQTLNVCILLNLRESPSPVTSAVCQRASKKILFPVPSALEAPPSALTPTMLSKAPVSKAWSSLLVLLEDQCEPAKTEETDEEDDFVSYELPGAVSIQTIVL